MGGNFEKKQTEGTLTFQERAPDDIETPSWLLSERGAVRNSYSEPAHDQTAASSSGAQASSSLGPTSAEITKEQKETNEHLSASA